MDKDAQYAVGKLLLDQLDGYGFVLAGGRALVELELTRRPTRDLDLFTKDLDSDRFAQAVEKALCALNQAGYSAAVEKQAETFARIHVVLEPEHVTVELGYDYREFDPPRLAIGPVLDARDAVLNKISALYARSMPRDFIDVFAIRKSGLLTDEELLKLSKERDDGFVLEYFVWALRRIDQTSFEDFDEYGVSKEHYEEIKQSTCEWATMIETTLSALGEYVSRDAVT